ncbi:outer membrane periplasmic chaperone, OmpH family protein [Psychroflexus gondwanensis ACAM 44]|jgi:outer membrane protein|uniref:Outer membrane periplasmic chaperone, OmpH family protein n=1 Tax=Psychroflexus gondwanensis ACAM 44 TaxID=1189619 RepID=N1X019_9FLAO|nr:OmpH family outer membrane protein [Psychroflexus gondwanensis]EMY82694.1 outer membrane periplasmic chaperone, OmpH family protein [Psychroflexus gondwanensis ACAM 44]
MKKILFSLTLVVSLMSCQGEKTAYVDNTVLIQEYNKMKTTEARFEKKSKALSDELDSIAAIFQQEVQEFQSNMKSMSTQERERRQGELVQKQQMLQQRQQQKSQMLRQESDQAIDSLIEEVKEYVGEYGKDKGYAYIFGSNESANIMYAKEGLDITEDVLEEINGEEKESDSTEKESMETESTEE